MGTLNDATTFRIHFPQNIPFLLLCWPVWLLLKDTLLFYCKLGFHEWLSFSFHFYLFCPCHSGCYKKIPNNLLLKPISTKNSHLVTFAIGPMGCYKKILNRLLCLFQQSCIFFFCLLSNFFGLERCYSMIVNNLALQRGVVFQWREISCQFLPPGGSMGPRYVLQLLFSEKSQNC